MKIFRSHFVALGLAAAALSSCGRSSYYSFQSKAPAYLGSVPVASAPVARPTPPATTASEPVAAVSAVVSAPPAAALPPVREAAPATLPAVTVAAVPTVATTSVAAAAPTTAAKLPLGQRLALHRVLKQAATAVARQQNTASVTHSAAAKDSSKSAFVVAVVGLISLIIGIVAGSGFLITLGVILLIIGAALYFFKLL